MTLVAQLTEPAVVKSFARTPLGWSGLFIIALSLPAPVSAQPLGNVPCPRVFQRPETLEYVSEVLQRLEQQRSQWKSNDVLTLIGRELPAELRLKLPGGLLEVSTYELENIGRATIDACWPAMRVFVAELDAGEMGYVPRRTATGASPSGSAYGAATPNAPPSARDLARREADLAQWRADEARAQAERDQYRLAQEAARRAAEEEQQRLAAAAVEARQAAIRQREEEIAQQRAERERVRQERAEQERIQLAARQAAEEQAQFERDERVRRAEDKRQAAVAAEKEFIRQSTDWTPKRRLLAAYRRSIIAQRCYDAFASRWFGKSYLDLKQWTRAQTLFLTIESSLLKLDASLDKAAIRAVAAAEERRIETDLDLKTLTPRGPIYRQEWDDESLGFCEQQLEGLRLEASNLQTSQR